MYAILKSTLRASASSKKTSDRRIEPALDATYPWLFTDPVARACYSSRQQLDTLLQDIQTYIMQRGRWQPDELAAKRQLERWIALDVLSPCDTFADLSPHPTIYRATTAGTFTFDEWKLHFEPGDDVVFVPVPYRQTHPGITGPIRTGRFFVTNTMRLCCATYPFLGEQNRQQEYKPVSAWVAEYSHTR